MAPEPVVHPMAALHALSACNFQMHSRPPTPITVYTFPYAPSLQDLKRLSAMFAHYAATTGATTPGNQVCRGGEKFFDLIVQLALLA